VTSVVRRIWVLLLPHTKKGFLCVVSPPVLSVVRRSQGQILKSKCVNGERSTVNGKGRCFLVLTKKGFLSLALLCDLRGEKVSGSDPSSAKNADSG
jgi:hypothetical protein